MLGSGFLQQMAESFKYNRDLLGKRKTARDLYNEEIKNRGTSYVNVDIVELRARVAKRLKRNKLNEFIGRTAANLILLSLGVGFFWFIMSLDSLSFKIIKKKDGSGYFDTKVYHENNGMDLYVDYFKNGTKASETYYKNGMRHQNSESYYQSGEQFRSALYYKDTLITEVYFFISGDTIKNFPAIKNKEVYHVKLTNPRNKLIVEFDYYDGKILPDTYREKRN